MKSANDRRGHGRHRSEGNGVDAGGNAPYHPSPQVVVAADRPPRGPAHPLSQDPTAPGTAAGPGGPHPAPGAPPGTPTNGLRHLHLTRITSPSHLASLPPEFLSGDARRPLLHVDEAGNEYRYYLDPMRQAVFFILLMEMVERFSFYGINYTTTAYLTGQYNEDWNADMASVTASSYVSISTAVAYTTPFLGAYLADHFLGEYLAMIMATLLCYIPGLALIALTSVPQLLGPRFSLTAIRLGLLVLWPVGTGAVKACVNVFGAKQFHPILQSSLIESYYVNFYMCINIGALTGGIVVPLVAQRNVTAAYAIPVCMLGAGVLLFVGGTGRSVRPKPRHDVTCRGTGGAARRAQRDRAAPARAPPPGRVTVGTIIRLSSLIVPFNIAYSQMSTTFILQGTVMANWGLIDAPMMNNVDALSILALGYVIGNRLYPALAARGIKIPTTYKFALGSTFGALAVGSAILTDYRIHRAYRETGEAVTVLWQVFPYFLIGVGEIFAVSSAYELAFTVAPAEMKAVASAANLFMVGGLPNVFCFLMYNLCGGWFRNAKGDAKIARLDDYASAKVVNYFWLLEGITLLGICINVLPPVRRWVEGIEEAAAVDVKSPMTTPHIRRNLLKRREGRDGEDEETPLVRAQKHAAYLQGGDGPELRKFGSLRAGGPMKAKKKKGRLLPHAEEGPGG